jgi:hypothetical protein
MCDLRVMPVSLSLLGGGIGKGRWHIEVDGPTQ